MEFCFFRIHLGRHIYCQTFCYDSFNSSLIFTACKRSLKQGNVFTPVCHSVYWGGLHPGWSASWGGLHPGGVEQALHSPPPPRYYGIRSMSKWYASYWDIFTAHKQSLGQGNIFIGVCQEFFS